MPDAELKSVLWRLRRAYLAGGAGSGELLEWFRAHREWVIESTPPAQMLLEAKSVDSSAIRP